LPSNFLSFKEADEKLDALLTFCFDSNVTRSFVILRSEPKTLHKNWLNQNQNVIYFSSKSLLVINSRKLKILAFDARRRTRQSMLPDNLECKQRYHHPFKKRYENMNNSFWFLAVHLLHQWVVTKYLLH